MPSREAKSSNLLPKANDGNGLFWRCGIGGGTDWLFDANGSWLSWLMTLWGMNWGAKVMFALNVSKFGM